MPKKSSNETLLNETIKLALDDLKGIDVLEMDVRELTSIADQMFIATGTSSRHVKALSRSVIDLAKEKGFRPLSTEGEEASDWVLVDFGDVIVHVMLPETREFYDLERLWTLTPDSRRQDS
jgi:ribosome-associated protein